MLAARAMSQDTNSIKKFVGFATAPDPIVVAKAKEEAQKLFPDDEAAQRGYWLTKGAATMQFGVTKAKD